METLLDAIEKYIRLRSNKKIPPPLMVAHQQAFQKLPKYYAKSDNGWVIYVAATMFSPETRYQYFVNNWKAPNLKPWLHPMLDSVRKHYHKHYFGKYNIEQPPAKRPTPLGLPLSRALNIAEDTTPFDAYVLGPQTPVSAPMELNLLAWWSTGRSRLRQFACDLSIPATIAAIERVFSSAGNLLGDEHSNKMNSDTIEARELSRNWQSQEIL